MQSCFAGGHRTAKATGNPLLLDRGLDRRDVYIFGSGKIGLVEKVRQSPRSLPDGAI